MRLPSVSTGCFARCRLGVALACAIVAASAEPLTLAQAQRLAAACNPDLRSAGLQVAAALAQRQGAREFPNPTLGVSTGKINSDGRTNRTDRGNSLLDRSYDTVISLGQLLEIGGKRGLRQASATASVRTAEAQLADARRLLTLAVTQAYVAAAAARETAAVRTASAASLRHEAEIAAHRQTAGDLSASDRAQIELAADQLDLDAAAAAADAVRAVLLLETLLGEPHPAGLTELAETLAGLPVTNSAAGDTPAVDRPDLAAAAANVERASSDLDLARRGRIPDVTVSVQYERQPPDQPNTVGVGVTLPLPLWNRNGGAIASARAAREQAEAALAKLRIQAAAEVASARLAFDEAAARARRYAAVLQPRSAEVARTVAYAYDRGGASLLELLAAERGDNDVRLAAVRARADWLNAAAALAAALNRPAGGSNP